MKTFLLHFKLSDSTRFCCREGKCSFFIDLCLGALIYRVIPPRNDSHKLGLKIGHAVVMMITFIIMVVGLQV